MLNRLRTFIKLGIYKYLADSFFKFSGRFFRESDKKNLPDINSVLHKVLNNMLKRICLASPGRSFDYRVSLIIQQFPNGILVYLVH